MPNAVAPELVCGGVGAVDGVLPSVFPELPPAPGPVVESTQEEGAKKPIQVPGYKRKVAPQESRE